MFHHIVLPTLKTIFHLRSQGKPEVQCAAGHGLHALLGRDAERRQWFVWHVPVDWVVRVANSITIQ